QGGGAAGPLRCVDPRGLADRPPVPCGDRDLVGAWRRAAADHARGLVGRRGWWGGGRVRAGGLRAVLLRADAGRPAHARVGRVVHRPLDPRGRAELPAGAPAGPDPRGDRGQHRVQDEDGHAGAGRVGGDRTALAGSAARGGAGPLRARGARHRARRGDPVRDRLRERAARVLDDARDRDRRAALRHLAFPRRAHRAALVAATGRRRRGWRAVVPVHDRVPGRGADGRGHDGAGTAARVRLAVLLVGHLGRRVPAGLDARTQEVRGGGRVSRSHTRLQIRMPRTSTPPPSRRPGLLAVLRAFWSANLAEELAYRANLAASVLGTVFWMGAAVLTAGVFFRQTAELGGWGFWEVVALLGVFNAVAGVVEALLRPNIGRLVQHVRDGTMDLILAKPLDPQVHVSFRRVVIWKGTDILLGLGLAGYALVRAGTVPSATSVRSEEHTSELQSREN